MFFEGESTFGLGHPMKLRSNILMWIDHETWVVFGNSSQIEMMVEHFLVVSMVLLHSTKYRQLTNSSPNRWNYII